jgi:poly-gamma-glutamate synthesis protein (capsule biosynthesis protein)
MRRFLPILVLVFLSLVSFTASAETGAKVRIALLGDFLPGGSAGDVIRDRGYGYLFDGVRPILASADAVILNMESPISTKGVAREGKAYTFRISPDVVGAMAREGVKAVWLANNHIMDFGEEALYDTINYLDAAGIAHAGAGRNVAAAAAPATLTLSGLKVSLISFSNTFPDSYWAQRDRPGTFFGAPGPVGRAVKRTLASRGGPVIVSFHWGEELMTEPKEYQEDLARRAVDHGAALVVGHHPHVPQPVEVYKGVPIFYSLGNFAFGSYSWKVRVGILAVAVFDADGSCSALEIHPILVENHEVNFSPRPLTGTEGKRVFKRLVKRITPDQAEVKWDGEKGLIIPNKE